MGSGTVGLPAVTWMRLSQNMNGTLREFPRGRRKTSANNIPKATALQYRVTEILIDDTNLIVSFQYENEL